jgi:hypothetical protein
LSAVLHLAIEFQRPSSPCWQRQRAPYCSERICYKAC